MSVKCKCEWDLIEQSKLIVYNVPEPTTEGKKNWWCKLVVKPDFLHEFKSRVTFTCESKRPIIRLLCKGCGNNVGEGVQAGLNNTWCFQIRTSNKFDPPLSSDNVEELTSFEVQTLEDYYPERKNKPPATNTILPESTVGMQNRGRLYQEEATNEALRKKLLIGLPTGTGKTWIGAQTIKKFKECNPKKMTIFVVPTQALVIQQAKYIKKETNLKVTPVHGNIRDEMSLLTEIQLHEIDVLVITDGKLLMWTAWNQICLDEFSLVVFDEAHNMRGNSPYSKLCKQLMSLNPRVQPHVLALSASPDNLDDLKLQMGVTLYKFTPEAIINLRKYYCPPKIKIELHIPTNQDIEFSNWIEGEIYNIIVENDLSLNRFAMSEVYNLVTLCDNPNRDIILQLKDLYEAWAINNAIGCKEAIDLLEASDSDILKALDRSSYDDVTTESKVDKLTSIVYTHVQQNRNSKVIIFVETFNTAKWLEKKLKRETTIKVGVTAGQEHQKKSDLDEILQDFREGNINVIISTPVLQEGIDVPECDLVVMFDEPKSLRSFIQSKGRARANESKYIIFCKSGQEIKKLKKKEKEFWKKNYKEVFTSTKRPNNNTGFPMEIDSDKKQRTE